MRKTLNKALLRKVAARLRRLRHEEHYNQATWAAKRPGGCGTAGCIAGHVVMVLGMRMKWLKGYDSPNYPSATHCVNSRSKKKQQIEIRDAAEKALGLTPMAADRLFSAHADGWPEEFRTRWYSEERHSRIAADLLDAIADGKVSLG